MIDIMTEQDRNLKNVKQIGTPREENKIYIENFAYAKLKENSFKEKRVFVLMGHTERMGRSYATFVEAVIPVKEIEFFGGIPRWTNAVWSEVFREIKRKYDDMIIVGWVIDVKGMSLRVSPELERVHREHFGGMHQLLFLLDTLEQEETFYMYKENKIVPKDGFFIYHRARREKEEQEEIQEKEIELEVDVSDVMPIKDGRYRQMLLEKQNQKSTDNGNVGLVIAVALLLIIAGIGLYDNRDVFMKNEESVEASVFPEINRTEEGIVIEDTIPVEVISGEKQE